MRRHTSLDITLARAWYRYWRTRWHYPIAMTRAITLAQFHIDPATRAIAREWFKAHNYYSQL